MKLTFLPDQIKGVRCEPDSAQVHFSFHDDTDFENQEFLFSGEDFLLDGYSHWFRGGGSLFREQACFSVSLCFIPLGVSSCGDGIFSFYNREQCRGMEIILEKDGKLSVHLGSGAFPISFSSVRGRVLTGVRNVVTVIYRGDAGWCDLYLNGVFSNRKQFRRHTDLRWPEGGAYLGRRVDGSLFREESSLGCFYGFLQWAEFDCAAPEEAYVLSLHRSVFSGKLERGAAALGRPDRNAYRNDRQRPAYHLIPAGKWTNEPHGPMYYDGWYHIFHQANPHAPVFDNLCWGHLVSRDMVHWEDCPLALWPEVGTVAPDGCWSGSGLIDKEGKPRIYYTAGNNGCFPNQAVALATPASDAGERLENWIKHPDLIQEQNIGWMGEFRDPFVWLENGSYFMLVGTGDEHNGGGNAALYSSADGCDWECHGFLVDYDFTVNQEVGHVWELPVLLPLRDEQGETVCHILLLCACQIESDIVETYYFLGHWDAEKKTFEKLHERAGLLDLGRGVFTGPSGFVTPDGRSVVFTIAQGQRPHYDEVHSGWAHNGGLPVELSVRNGQLHLRPIRELETLRNRKLLDASRMSVQEANRKLAELHGDQLCLEYTASGDFASVRLCSDFGYKEVYYARNDHRLGVRDDRGQDIGRWRGEIDDVVIGDEPIRFTCYLDHSMLEIYVNGRKSVSLRNYTNGGDRTFQILGEPERITLWEMNSAYETK